MKVSKLILCSVLMQWAECGSLDDLISTRLGHGAPLNVQSPNGGSSTEEIQSRSDRIRAFRSRKAEQGTNTPGPRRETKAIHLLSGEELRSLFGDIVSGLAFLVRYFETR
jgi:hypothetical protein